MTSFAVTTTGKAAAASTRQVNVRLFAHARELAGGESVCVTVSEQATIGELRHALVARFPAAAELLRRSIFAIDSEYVADEVVVPGGSREIACIPPVSGG
jgi:molybdopterin converting factor small subunit